MKSMKAATCNIVSCVRYISIERYWLHGLQACTKIISKYEIDSVLYVVITFIHLAEMLVILGHLRFKQPHDCLYLFCTSFSHSQCKCFALS